MGSCYSIAARAASFVGNSKAVNVLRWTSTGHVTYLARLEKVYFQPPWGHGAAEAYGDGASQPRYAGRWSNLYVRGLRDWLRQREKRPTQILESYQCSSMVMQPSTTSDP